MTRPQDADIGRLREAARRVVESHGLELFDLQLRRESIGWVLRVIIDRLGGPGTGGRDEAIGIEDCQRVSHDLGTLLDVEDLIGLERYTFEVSSPGLDRPLRGEADYRRFEGRLAKVVTREPIGGQTSFAGRLAGVSDGVVTLEEGRRTHRVPIAAISRARLEVEF